MWMILASSSLSMIGNGSVSCRQLSGPGLQQVRLRAHRTADRGDDLFTNRVERRVGDLGEELLEVVEQQARPLAEHGDRGVGAHRADRLATLLGHRGDDDLQLFVRVAEHLLAAQHALMAEHHVLALGQLAELDHAFFEPLRVRLGLGQRPLDLVVFDDLALRRVDQEHAPRLQTALANDLRRVDVEHTDFAGHDHQIVVGHPVAARAAGRCGRAPRRSACHR